MTEINGNILLKTSVHQPTFSDTFYQYNWDDVRNSIYSKTSQDVIRALNSPTPTIEDFKALVSPAADAHLEEIAQLSRKLTLQRFGNTMQLYAPMYLSNECQNICTYCGFSLDNKIRRKTLNPAEIEQEAKAIKKLGFKHILLVTGEANKTVGVPYFVKALKIIRPYFDNVSIEVQPLNQDEYKTLVDAGVHSVLVYQETYHKEDYKKHHPKGKKSNFDYRLETPDRLGRAGVHKIGLGALYGLEDWRVDSFFVALHLQYLEKTYWKTKYTISFPRLRPFSGGLEPKVEMTDRNLVQLIGAYRAFNQEVELSLSTRESEVFRNNAMKLGVTSMSAESKTNPGGYDVEPQSLEQFEISDDRTVEQMVKMIQSNGYEAVWKDWDKTFEV